MKKPYYLILIALGIALIITGAIVFNRTEFVNPTKIEQVKVFDLIHHSGGYVNIAVEHPSELLPKEEAQITLTASPDEKNPRCHRQRLYVRQRDEQLKTHNQHRATPNHPVKRWFQPNHLANQSSYHW